MRRDSDLKLSLILVKDELLRTRRQTSLSLPAKRWSIDGLFGQDISSLSNVSFNEKQGEHARRMKDKKRESEGRYGAVLREYHSQWRVETRTSLYSSSNFLNDFYSGVNERVTILQSCA